VWLFERSAAQEPGGGAAYRVGHSVTRQGTALNVRASGALVGARALGVVFNRARKVVRASAVRNLEAALGRDCAPSAAGLGRAVRQPDNRSEADAALQA